MYKNTEVLRSIKERLNSKHLDNVKNLGLAQTEFKTLRYCEVLRYGCTANLKFVSGILRLNLHIGVKINVRSSYVNAGK